MKTKEQLNDKLSIAIFARPTAALDDIDQVFFVNMHRRYYNTYLKSIISKVDTYYKTTKRLSKEEIKRSKKKRGDEYELIFEWYTRRIPLHIVLSAIRYCIDYKSERRESITTILYYRGRVNQKWAEYNRQVSNEWIRFELPSGEIVYDPWMFEVWRIYKDYKFDLFEGPIK